MGRFLFWWAASVLAIGACVIIALTTFLAVIALYQLYEYNSALGLIVTFLTISTSLALLLTGMDKE
jgi:hypothetical protein